MYKTIVIMALALGATPFVAPAFAAGSSSVQMDLLGKDPGKAAGYSCFTRHYDDAHLASHPKQNVTNISVFVESTYDADADTKRDNYVELGVNFRGLSKPFEVTGNCDTTVDGKKALSCGGDCGGGAQFDISTQGPNSLIVSMPEPVDVFDPSVDPNAETTPDLPKEAAFASDDKQFKLDRVDVKQCQALMSDDAKTAIYGTAAVSK